MNNGQKAVIGIVLLVFAIGAMSGPHTTEKPKITTPIIKTPFGNVTIYLPPGWKLDHASTDELEFIGTLNTIKFTFISANTSNDFYDLSQMTFMSMRDIFHDGWGTQQYFQDHTDDWHNLEVQILHDFDSGEYVAFIDMVNDHHLAIRVEGGSRNPSKDTFLNVTKSFRFVD